MEERRRLNAHVLAKVWVWKQTGRMADTSLIGIPNCEPDGSITFPFWKLPINKPTSEDLDSITDTEVESLSAFENRQNQNNKQEIRILKRVINILLTRLNRIDIDVEEIFTSAINDERNSA